MDEIINALREAARSLVHPIILVIVLVPMAIAGMAWAGLAWIYWDTWTAAVQDFIRIHLALTWAAYWQTGRLVSWIAAGFVLLLLAPLMLLTALLIAAVFAMPVLVRHVGKRHFPTLERRHGGTLLGSFWNVFVALSLFASLWIVTLPVWLLGPFAVPLPVLLSAWVNQRLFRYDALSEHADAAEMRQIFRSARGRLYMLGLATGLFYFIPPINLVAPIYAALAFIHLCLAELQRLRCGDIRDED